MDLILENVRCFHTRQVVPIKPLTLLVGENSTGKSTFLAAFRIAWDIAWGTNPTDFNEEPFQLGTYDQIANYRGGRGGRAKSLTIGLQLDWRESHRQGSERATPPGPLSILATFAKGEAQPKMSATSVETKNLSLLVRWPLTRDAELELEVTENGKTFSPASRGRGLFLDGFPFSQVLPYLLHVLRLGEKGKASQDSLSKATVERLLEFFGTLHSEQSGRPRAIAPIRSKPERVYSRMEDRPLPSGGHVPMVLAHAFGVGTAKSADLQKALLEFGSACGMFDKLEVSRFGKKESDPFQVLVGSQSPPFSLVDVGYGVSQVLPILVDSLVAPPRTTFLLQQPEVHLHPRAQAELGTFFGRLAKDQDKTFIVETHSDYIIDRVRMDIRDRKGLKASDVAILFFEKDEAGVAIHPISIDESGNIEGAPPGYRRFFMEEEKRYFAG